MEKTNALWQERLSCVPGTSQTPWWLEQSSQTEQSKGYWEPGHHSATIQVSHPGLVRVTAEEVVKKVKKTEMRRRNTVLKWPVN